MSDRVPGRECDLLPIHPAALIAPQHEPTVAVVVAFFSKGPCVTFLATLPGFSGESFG